MTSPSPTPARQLADGHAARQRGDPDMARRCYEAVLQNEADAVSAGRARLALAALDAGESPGRGRGRQAIGLVLAGFIVGYLCLIVLPREYNVIALLAVVLCLVAGLVRAVQAMLTPGLRTRLGGIAAAAIVAAMFLGAAWYEGAERRLALGREAIERAALSQRAVARLWRVTGELPASNEAALLPSPERLAGGNIAAVRVREAGTVEVTLGGDLLAGQTLLLRPTARGDALHWDCSGGTLDARARPPDCR